MLDLKSPFKIWTYKKTNIVILLNIFQLLKALTIKHYLKVELEDFTNS